MPLVRAAAPDPAFSPAMFAAQCVLGPPIGVAAWLVWRRIDVGLERKRAALRRWGWLVLLSALWPPVLRTAGPAAALVPLLASLLASAIAARAFRPISRAAAVLILPNAAWLALAAYLLVVRF